TTNNRASTTAYHNSDRNSPTRANPSTKQQPRTKPKQTPQNKPKQLQHKVAAEAHNPNDNKKKREDVKKKQPYKKQQTEAKQQDCMD
ncbi:hypothetical protein, partial [Streptococcus suis]|uniref:hypothetical protein n=1 Tax=Streptococcus suis TaxID=1307 RepID=UPI0021195D0E